jgi:site-specific DNA-methyltransferase (adenine-specific)
MNQLDLFSWHAGPRIVIICADMATVDLGSLGLEFDALFSDPPYGLTSGGKAKRGFMGLSWDHGVPSAEVWSHLSKHLRPGAHVAAFGGTRTYHRLACAIEDSGLEIRDSIWTWLYGSGWPKPANVSKYIDKKLGHKREVIGENPNARASQARAAHQSTGLQTAGAPITAPASELAQAFEGWHANLKPAVEPLVLARKTLDGTLANNAIKHGLAGLNIDGCRIESEPRPQLILSGNSDHTNHSSGGRKQGGTSKGAPITNLGRWPSNVILTCTCARDDHEPGCPVRVLDEQSGQSKSQDGGKGGRSVNAYGKATERKRRGHNDSGGASRFFYCAKVSRAERAGLKHPTMKPLKLTEYLAKPLLPPATRKRAILIPCSGVCSEVIGAARAGWDVIVGIEQDPEHCRDGAERVKRVLGVEVERVGF